MARQYSPKTFIRKVPNELFRQYFNGKPIELLVDWDEIGDTDANPIFDAIQSLDDHVRASVESDFTEINELAHVKGVLAILEEAHIRKVDWVEEFDALDNHYARAFWTFLKQPEYFEAAGAFHQMDRFGGWWRRFVGKRLKLKTDRKTMKAFREELQAIYRPQGRGRFCKVDRYQRQKPVRDCFFAYPEDMATSDIGYSDDGSFNRRPRRSALEVIFVYRPEQGVVELHAVGGKKLEEALARAFCVTILGLRGLPDEGDTTPYDLSPLKNTKFRFPTKPRDGVEAVELKSLRLDLPTDLKKGASRRIILSASSLRTASNAVYALLNDALDLKRVRLDDMLLAHAKMTFVFRPREGKRAKRLTFEVTYPDRCTLKDDPYDQIARKYLKVWGIARD
ncbi:MAG TPA: hypothetical protein PKN33_03850 [Phycisphaerae bacterium]|nr:hypothetical protein [Phycisphaerae bacterium]